VTTFNKLRLLIEHAPAASRDMSTDDVLVFLSAWNDWYEEAAVALDHIPDNDPMYEWAERNFHLHIALRAAFNDQPGWRDHVHDLLMRPPNVTIIGSDMIDSGSDPTYANNEPMKCVDCGSDGAKWRNLKSHFAEPVFIKLCDDCLDDLKAYAKRHG